MKRLQKAAALVLALVVVFSASVVPAHAEEYVSRADIFSWIASQGKIGSIISQITGVGCPKNEDGRHVAHSCVYDGVAGHYVCTCDSCGDTFVATKSELHDAYDSHVDDMPLNGIDNTGGFYWRPTVDDIHVASSDYWFKFTYGAYGGSIYYLEFPHSQLPLSSSSCTYDLANCVISSIPGGLHLSVRANGTYMTNGYSTKFNPFFALNFDIAFEADYYYDYSGEKRISHLTSTHRDRSATHYNAGGYGDPSSPTAFNYTRESASDKLYRAEIDYYFPVFKVLPDGDIDSTPYTPDTRPGTITGKYLVQNGDAYEDSSTTIINEDDNSIYNPVTNTTTNYDSWSYDYSTRTYTMTDNTNNSTTTVTYGDENVTINEGGNTYNIYYGTVNNNGGGSDNQGGGSGSDDSGNSGSSGDTGIIAKLGEMLGTLVSGLLGGVTAFVSAVFDGLISLANVISDKFGQVVSAVLSWFAQIPELFAGFSAFLVAVFPFLPADVMLLLTFGLAAVVFIAIIKAIRR